MYICVAETTTTASKPTYTKKVVLCGWEGEGKEEKETKENKNTHNERS